MEIIDAHNHIWPKKVVRKAKECLEGCRFVKKLVTLPTVDNLLKIMDESEISKSIVSSIASYPRQVVSINNWLFSIKQKRLIPFASIHPFFNTFKEELKRIKDNAFGVKLQPEFQNFYVDDEKIFPLYEELQKLNLPVLVHCGAEISALGGVCSYSSPKRILRVIKKFPKLKIIGAHMGGFLMWEESLEKLAGKNIYFDTSNSIRVMKKEVLKQFFVKHGFDKIIYGSDFPIQNPKEEISFIKVLDISKENKQKILSSNIKKVLSDIY
ncbi:MAG: amidohydrolase family protein [Endomicrobium sp.]|jgi:predicted TIM-barrel fold metal-dependent hydrolase|nr:amidohydrolase family protein [Endomicrobium sp.]